jgi:PAT family beta-lactamase induction signal transducer AmpG
MELVAIYSLFMKASSSDQPGTDFTILACAELLIYLVGSSVAGYLADKFGYADLFTLATVLSALGIALTFYILRRLRGNGLAL